MKIKKEGWYYEIETINPTDYALTITLTTSGKLLNTIFIAAKGKLKKEKGINVNGDITDQKVIKIPQEYYRLLNTISSNIFKKTASIFKKDGIELVTNEIKNAIFIKKGDKWDINIQYGGLYADKR